MHDFTLLNKQLLPYKPWFSGLAVRIDFGFQGFADTYASSRLFLTTKKLRSGNLTKNNKFRNAQQARKCVAVEHSIGGLKCYRILSDRLRMHYLDQFDTVLEVRAGLWSFCLTR